MTTVEILNQNQINQLKNIQGIYNSFHYFSDCTTRDNSIHLKKDQSNPLYFMAIKNNELVGVLKLSNEISEVFPNSYVKYEMIAYIDVREDCKRQGIATELYKAVNEWAKNSDKIIVGTSMSSEGQNANLHQLRKSLLKDCNNFETEYELHSYIKLNCQTTA